WDNYNGINLNKDGVERKPSKPVQLTRINERLRFLKYRPGQFFQMHCDGSYWTPDAEEVSYYTIQIYLTGTATTVKGGATRIWSKSERSRGGPKGNGYIDVDPRMGRILVFEQDGILHSGEELVSGEKIAMRTEFMYGRPGDSSSELSEEEEAEDPDESEM
ncbi:hypothetical protein FRB99_004567, partial [Tulasnella sp. 403]